MRWLIVLLLVLASKCNANLNIDAITYKAEWPPGRIRLKYSGWRGAVVNEGRRQLYNMWQDSIFLRYDGGIRPGYLRELRTMSIMRADEDLIGRFWDRRWYDKPGQSSIVWSGSNQDVVNLGFVKLTADWRVDYKAFSGTFDQNIKWRIKPRASLGLTGIRNLGLGLELFDRRSWSFLTLPGWDVKRGPYIEFAFEIWRT